MSLQFLMGNSGSGKSHTIYQEIIKKAGENPRKKYLVIVPEQFTMQTQKELVQLSPSHGILNIDILSFQRLAYRVLGETGGAEYPVLEETGKTLVLQRVIQEEEKKLGVLSGSLRKTGTVSEMKSLVSELMQYAIAPDEIDEIIQDAEEKPLLTGKLQDVKIVYKGFLEYLDQKYITAEEVLDVLCEKISQSDLVRGCEMIFDGFTGFTPVQNKLIRQILKLADKVWVTVTADRKATAERMKNPQNLFHMSGIMMDQLTKMAAAEGVEIQKARWIDPGENSRFSQAPALGYLEQHLFRYGTKPYPEKQNEIEIFTALNPKEEVEEIVKKIGYLVRTEGYQYRDIGIIAGDLDTYGTYARQIMEEYRIPYFLDEKHSILMNPFVEFIRASVAMITENFTYESVFRYLRCSLSGLSVEQIDLLENYCLACGITGWKQWNQIWGRMYYGMTEDELDKINEIREQFLEELGDFVENFKEKENTVEEKTRTLYEFILRCRVQEQLKEKEEYFHEMGKQALEKEYGQIYKLIIDLLDKMVQVLGDEKISLADYQQILEAGFMEAQVGIIPPSADQVMIGDMERTRLKDIKVLFFAGVNDSVIPKRGGGGGLLSEADREYLKEQQVELAPTARESMYIQRFYMYLNMTKPSGKLYLSFAKTARDGSSIGPAFLIPVINRMFPDIVIRETDPMQIQTMERPGQAVPYLLEGLQESVKAEPDENWKEMLKWFLSSQEWRDSCLRWMKVAFMNKPQDQIGKAVAGALYGKVLDNSATELERFAACAFAHFLQYGLNLSEREKYEFGYADMGNILHKALEEFSKNLKRKKISWRDLDGSARDQLIDECVDQVTYLYGNTILESSARNQYMVKRVKRILRRTVWAIQKQIEAGKYEPDRFEISFSMEENLQASNFQLSKDESLHLRGRIDRVDRYEKDDTIYVKVIDYKSGNTSMDLIQLYYGLQLQLIVYMNGAIEMEQREHPDKKVEPAGVFYYRVKDPLTDGNLEEDEESIAERILQELKVNGLVREEKEVIHDLDESLVPGDRSKVIPVAYNKNGSLSRYSSTASLDQFNTLSQYVNNKIRAIGKDILNGNVKMNPYKFKNSTACDYCSFRDICGFDEKIPAYRYRKLSSFNGEELWKNLEEGAEE